MGREIITAFREMPSNLKNGKPLGITALRDQIMDPEDSIVGSQKVRSPLLTRQDLQHWLLRGVLPSNTKFWYVDRFIRTIQNEEAYKIILRRIIKHREDSYCRHLSDLYQMHNKKLKNNIANNKSNIEKKLFVSRRINSDDFASKEFSLPYVSGKSFRQISIYIGEERMGVFSIAVLYSDDLIERATISDDSSDYTVFLDL